MVLCSLWSSSRNIEEEGHTRAREGRAIVCEVEDICRLDGPCFCNCCSPRTEDNTGEHGTVLDNVDMVFVVGWCWFVVHPAAAVVRWWVKAWLGLVAIPVEVAGCLIHL